MKVNAAYPSMGTMGTMGTRRFHWVMSPYRRIMTFHNLKVSFKSVTCTATGGGGKLYHPIYEKPRNDSDISDCSITQLKYKTDKIAA